MCIFPHQYFCMEKILSVIWMAQGNFCSCRTWYAYTRWWKRWCQSGSQNTGVLAFACAWMRSAVWWQVLSEISAVCIVPGGQRVQLWQDLFSDPSQWWDWRLEKVSKEAFHVLQVPSFEEGRCFHEQFSHWSGCKSDVFVENSFIDMYAKCGSMEDWWRVFWKMLLHDAFLWTAMILGYANCGEGDKALQLFQQMQQEGVQPNTVTFLGLLNACASTVALEDASRTLADHSKQV